MNAAGVRGHPRAPVVRMREDDPVAELEEILRNVVEHLSAAPGAGPVPPRGRVTERAQGMASAELADLIQELSEQMRGAAAELHFEVAARLRDEISDLKKELRGMNAAGVR